MKNEYQIPTLTLHRFEAREEITATAEELLSDPFQYGEEIEEW